MKNKDNFKCSDLDQALREESPEFLAALDRHATTCTACNSELKIWREISAAAQVMHKEWSSPGLWPRIESALEIQAARPRGWRAWLESPHFGPALRWQVGMAVVALLLISGAGAWMLLHHDVTPPDNEHLLTEQTVHQVEQAEHVYEQSIDKLAKLAEPKLATASTPLLVNYREKLQLLDRAIGECRTNLEKNSANAYVRNELLSFYQEKQKTLEEVLRGN
jgi:hypothetical protein